MWNRIAYGSSGPIISHRQLVCALARAHKSVRLSTRTQSVRLALTSLAAVIDMAPPLLETVCLLQTNRLRYRHVVLLVSKRQ